ncbi:MAG: hypothetical protein IPJ13_27325 [Saprospiraceae bacterium]|jgi:hypothetical protein|nr:hypothetical protein [Saprospiraceae bacterium]MBP9197545.1 hypothetical protein [Saprospiraceae bacterium]
MSSIILNSIIILIILIPMAYFFLGGKNKSKEISNLKTLANQKNLSPEKTGQWQAGVIGLDKKQNKLCYINNTDDQHVQVIDISDITKCDVSKQYQNERAHEKDISMLKKVSLRLKLKNNSEISIPVYDADVNPNPGNDLLEAMDWEKIINNLIKGK